MKRGSCSFEREFIEIGLKIGYYRRKRGLTQEQLAERAAISPGYLSQIEAPNLVTRLSVQTLLQIARVLEVPPHVFLQFDREG